MATLATTASAVELKVGGAALTNVAACVNSANCGGRGTERNRPKIRQTLQRRCQPIYSRICYSNGFCKYAVTGYRCRAI